MQIFMYGVEIDVYGLNLLSLFMGCVHHKKQTAEMMCTPHLKDNHLFVGWAPYKQRTAEMLCTPHLKDNHLL